MIAGGFADLDGPSRAAIFNKICLKGIEKLDADPTAAEIGLTVGGQREDSQICMNGFLLPPPTK